MTKKTASQARNTFVDLEMIGEDGGTYTVKLTLAYRYLMALSAADKRAYDEYNKVYNKKDKDEIDLVKIAYTAYLCAAIQEDRFDDAMDWDGFLDAVTPDREALGTALTGLLAPKRLGDIGKRSA